MKLYDDIATFDELPEGGLVIATLDPSAYVTDVVVDPSALVTEALDAPCNMRESGAEFLALFMSAIEK